MDKPKVIEQELPQMHVLQGTYLRELVDKVNALKIQKADIVSLIANDEQSYYLIYYK